MRRRIGKKRLFFLVIPLAALFLMVAERDLVYNRLIDKQHFVHIAKSRVEAERQRRYDVVYGNMAVAKRYIEMERQVLEKLSTLNGMIQQGAPARDRGKLQDEIIVLMRDLNLIAESYPKIRAKGPYMFLMEAMQEAGTRLSSELHNYNRILFEYNVFCRMFPFNIFARLSGFREEEFYEAVHGANKAPAFLQLLK
uniref:Magnetosome protein MamQ-II n=1 Tax=uncultured Nitrospirota bacterium TaxID=170969 RepID=A0A142BU50_9BACT|nr:magnetosome protein MamQ-II [uncultured Nitrospirota bacterium]